MHSADDHAAYLDASVEVPGRAVFAPGTLLDLPLAVLHTVVFPGDTVPLRLPIQQPHALRALEQHIAAGGAFFSAISLDSDLSEVGCTLEVRRRSSGAERDPRLPPVGELQLVTVARQRCRIVTRHSPELRRVTVRVLADVSPLPPPLARVLSAHAHRSFWRSNDPTWLCDRLWDASVSAGIPLAHHMSRAALGPRAARWRAVAADEAAFSFFVARNIAAPPETRLRLLAEDCVSTRLRLCLRALRSIADSLACIACGQAIVESAAAARLPVSLNDEGMPIFTNPAAFSFRVTLVSRVRTGSALVHHRRGGPELADTWYAGYGWSLLACSGCGSHVGWRYDWLGGGGGALAAAGVARIRWDASADNWVAWIPATLAAERPLPTANPTADHGSARFLPVPLAAALEGCPPPHGHPSTFFGLHGGAVAAPRSRAARDSEAGADNEGSVAEAEEAEELLRGMGVA